MTAAVITWLLNAVPDPQRNTHIGADAGLLSELRESVAGHGRTLVVLHDCLDEQDDEHTSFVRVPAGGNPYWARWRHALHYLASHPEVEYAWCVDGTDTQMLNDPFPHMAQGLLYAGSEEATLGTQPQNGWLNRHCPSVAYFVSANPSLRLVNMGTLGGHRDILIEAIEAIAAQEECGDDWEMGAFQRIAAEDFAGRLVTGPMVHTLFLHGERDSPAWWRHK